MIAFRPYNIWLTNYKLYRHEWFTSTGCEGQEVMKIGNLVHMTILTSRYSHSGA